MRVSPGRITGSLIVAAWILLFGAQARRSYAPLRAEEAPTWIAGERERSQRGVYIRGSRIGYLRETLLRLPDGFQTEQEGRFRIKVLERERPLEIAGTARVDSRGELRHFAFRLSTFAGAAPFETVVRGRIEGGQLHLVMHSGGVERSESRALEAAPTLTLNIFRSLAARGLASGRSFRIPVLDPLTLRQDEAVIEVQEKETIHVLGREEVAFRVLQRFAGVSSTAWLSAEGELLKEETALGWILMKEPWGERDLQNEATPDLVAVSAIPAAGFGSDPRSLRWARLGLRGFPAGWSGIDGGRQKFTEDEVLITRESLPPASPATLTEAERERWLKADLFVQSDHPDIIARAKTITDDLSPLEAARALNDWVHGTVRKEPTASLPNALEVLRQRVGDCNEHTVLFAALARAAGIPTRLSTGLAWSSGAFYYHAWAEVWLGEWIAIDPTFGQFPADAVHIRLLSGGIEGQFEVLQLIGRRASVEFLEGS